MAKPSVYIEKATRELSKLPGIGGKSASRIAFYMLGMDRTSVERLVSSIIELKDNITTCSVCGGISDGDVCAICSDPVRDSSILCVVEGARDIFTIEASGEFRGFYHVLGGLISPLDGIGPDDLNIQPLIKRCGTKKPDEVILALNPTIEGDATTLYLAGLLSPLGLKVTRIAHGLPVGSDLEFADSATVAKSIEGRVRI